MNFNLILFFILFSSCCQNRYDTKLIINRNNDLYIEYYKDERIISVVNYKPQQDSTFIVYENDSEYTTKFYHLIDGKYKIYKTCTNNSISDKVSLCSDGSEPFYENLCISDIKWNNKFNLLENDFCYLSTLTQETSFKKSTSNTSSFDTIYFKNTLEVGQLNRSDVSLFLYGTQIKKLAIFVQNNFLKEVYAEFINEPTNELIKYRKTYEYNAKGYLIRASTKNIDTGEIEDIIEIKYQPA